MTRETWAGRAGFVLATVGFSVGLGNIWRFPYLLGENGGAAFLLVYVVIAVVVGIPLFTAEVSLGRASRATPIEGMRKLTGSRGSPWNLVGWFGVGAALLILSYYQVIAAWILSYLGRFVTGQFGGVDPAAAAGVFDRLVADPVEVLALALVVALVLGGIVSRGLQRGIERVARLLVPFLFVALAVLAVYAMLLPGAGQGLRWLLTPDLDSITPSVVLAALGQVFFSVGVGMAAAFTYGSYLDPEDSDVPGNAAVVVAADTVAALVAGLVMFPALFAAGIEPDQGPGLLFVSMLGVFTSLPAGEWLGAAFFLLVTVAGLTSGMALLEAVAATAVETLGLDRRSAVWGSLAGTYLLGVPSALSFGPWTDVRVFGRSIFGLVDFVSGSVLLTATGLLIVLYTACSWGFDRFREEANRGAGRIRVTPGWKPLVTLVVPAAVAIVLLAGLGVVG